MAEDPERQMNEVVSRAREMLSRATPGPWAASENGTGAIYVHAVTPVVRKRHGRNCLEQSKRQIGKFYDGYQGRCPGRPENGKANAELAAAAPELIERLCAEIERLEARS